MSTNNSQKAGASILKAEYIQKLQEAADRKGQYNKTKKWWYDNYQIESSSRASCLSPNFKE